MLILINVILIRENPDEVPLPVKLFIEFKKDIPILCRQFLNTVIRVKIQNVVLFAELAEVLLLEFVLLDFYLKILFVKWDIADEVLEVCHHTGFDFPIDWRCNIQGWTYIYLD